MMTRLYPSSMLKVVPYCTWCYRCEEAVFECGQTMDLYTFTDIYYISLEVNNQNTMSLIKSSLLVFLLIAGTYFATLRFKSSVFKKSANDKRKFYVYSVPEDLLYNGYNMRPETCPFQIYAAEIVVPEYIKRHKLRFEADPDKASFFMVPQFSSCYYHMCLQEAGSTIDECKQKTRQYFEGILNWVEDTYPYWDRNGGKDHLFVFSWDQGSELLGYNSVLSNRVASSIHLVHHGKRGKDDQNYVAEKDVVIPVYRNFFTADRIKSKNIHKKIFAYFRGTLSEEFEYGQGARKYIRYLGQSKPGKYFVKEGHSEYYWNELAHSTFAFCPPGWSLWSPRFYDALVSNSIPVLFGNTWVLPFEGLIDYSALSIVINEKDIKSTEKILQNIKASETRKMIEAINNAVGYLRYDDDNIEDGPIEFILREILSKHPGLTTHSEPRNVLRALDNEEDSENY